MSLNPNYKNWLDGFLSGLVLGGLFGVFVTFLIVAGT